MRITRGILLAALIAGTAGCYHAVITTGRQANGQTIERPWAHSFIAGLVPPSVTETAAQCPNGIARVETQHSFLNLVAQFVTFSIYSPMTITVQCAGGANQDAEGGRVQARDGDAAGAMAEAIRRSAETHEPVWVELR